MFLGAELSDQSIIVTLLCTAIGAESAAIVWLTKMLLKAKDERVKFIEEKVLPMFSWFDETMKKKD